MRPNPCLAKHRILDVLDDSLYSLADDVGRKNFGNDDASFFRAKEVRVLDLGLLSVSIAVRRARADKSSRNEK